MGDSRAVCDVFAVHIKKQQGVYIREMLYLHMSVVHNCDIASDGLVMRVFLGLTDCMQFLRHYLHGEPLHFSYCTY